MPNMFLSILVASTACSNAAPQITPRRLMMMQEQPSPQVVNFQSPQANQQIPGQMGPIMAPGRNQEEAMTPGQQKIAMAGAAVLLAGVFFMNGKEQKEAVERNGTKTMVAAGLVTATVAAACYHLSTNIANEGQRSRRTTTQMGQQNMAFMERMGSVLSGKMEQHHAENQSAFAGLGQGLKSIFAQNEEHHAATQGMFNKMFSKQDQTMKNQGKLAQLTGMGFGKVLGNQNTMSGKLNTMSGKLKTMLGNQNTMLSNQNTMIENQGFMASRIEDTFAKVKENIGLTNRSISAANAAKRSADAAHASAKRAARNSVSIWKPWSWR